MSKKGLFVIGLLIGAILLTNCGPSGAAPQKSCEGNIKGVAYSLNPGQSFKMEDSGNVTTVRCTSDGRTEITVERTTPPTAIPRTATSTRPTQPPVSREWFQLVNRHSQKCLTLEPGDDHLVQQPCYLNRDSQLWKLPEGIIFTYLAPLQAKNGLCVGIRPGHAEVVKASCGSVPVWKIDPICTTYFGCPPLPPHPHPAISPIETGPYYIIKYGDQCLDLESWEHFDGAAIIHYGCRQNTEDMDNQLWAKHAP